MKAVPRCEVGIFLLGLLGLCALVAPASSSPASDPVPCRHACQRGGAGESFAFALARYKADGSPDRSFGAEGVVRTSFGTGSPLSNGADIRSLLIQPDRGIVAAGTALAGPVGGFAVARYGADGSHDASFGDGGRLITALGNSREVTARAAVSQPDRDIVVAGSAGSDFALVRYRPDGSLDTSFGQAGIVTTDLGGTDEAEDIAVQPDGGIVAAGRSGSSIALARYGPDGSLDGSFGDGGRVVVHDASPAIAVLVQPNGMLVALERPSLGGDRGFRLSRFTPGGALDRAFGHGGAASALVARDGRAQAATLGPEGEVVVAGEARSDGRTNRDLAIARFNPSGRLDRSFGEAGKVVARRPGGERPMAVMVKQDGAITVGGVAWTRGAREAQVVISRYNPDGSLHSFVPRGQTIMNGGRATAAALARDGKVIVASSPGRIGPRPVELAGARHHHGDRATTHRRVTKAAHHRRSHRRGPPHPVPAFYINAHNFEELKRFAASDACAFARRQPPGGRRTLILDFGGARAFRHGKYGASVNHKSFQATNGQIRIALKVAADAYASCHRRGRVRITYATTNHFKTKRSAHHARRIGVNQARSVRRVDVYQRRSGYRPAVRSGVAGDIEMTWWGPKQSRALVNGAKSVWRQGYLDFGTAGGCPPHPPGLNERGCFNGWTVRDVAFVSRARGGHPVPEVYYRGGPSHFDQAAQWANVARYWNARHKRRYRFFGATGSSEFANLSPRQSWKRLREKAPGRVRRELLNFMQDRRLRR